MRLISRVVMSALAATALSTTHELSCTPGAGEVSAVMRDRAHTVLSVTVDT